MGVAKAEDAGAAATFSPAARVAANHGTDAERDA
jgi:hypothetical protein